MAAATTTTAEFLNAAKRAFEDRFGGDPAVMLPDGYAAKVEQGYEGAMIVLSVEFAAADPDERQGGFDTPTRTNLRVHVYTAVGFANKDGENNAYLAGLNCVDDIIGWCGLRRFITGQRGLEFIEMEAGDYDVKSNFQIPWTIDFAAPLRLSHDRTSDEDPFKCFGDYYGQFPPNSVRLDDSCPPGTPEVVYLASFENVAHRDQYASLNPDWLALFNNANADRPTLTIMVNGVEQRRNAAGDAWEEVA